MLRDGDQGHATFTTPKSCETPFQQTTVKISLESLCNDTAEWASRASQKSSQFDLRLGQCPETTW